LLDFCDATAMVVPRERREQTPLRKAKAKRKRRRRAR
jgi:hypothetical protein